MSWSDLTRLASFVALAGSTAVSFNSDAQAITQHRAGYVKCMLNISAHAPTYDYFDNQEHVGKILANAIEFVGKAREKYSANWTVTGGGELKEKTPDGHPKFPTMHLSAT